MCFCGVYEVAVLNCHEIFSINVVCYHPIRTWFLAIDYSTSVVRGLIKFLSRPITYMYVYTPHWKVL